MEKIFVPRDKCIFKILAEMGETITNSWIFFQDGVIQRMDEIRDSFDFDPEKDEVILVWEQSVKYPKTELHIRLHHEGWFFCTFISAEDIAYTVPADEPDRMILVELEG